MNRFFSIVLVLVLAIVSVTACGGKKDSSGNGGNRGASTGSAASKNGNQALITEDMTTGVGSIAREQYYAETMREEFAFDRNGILTDHKRIYTFENGVNDRQKQRALDTLIEGNFSASIAGNTIVIDGKGNYLGFPYAESNLAEIKERLEGRGTKYNLGAAGTVTVLAQSGGGNTAGGNTVDINTVEGRLSKAGLKLEDIKPATFAEASLYNCDRDEIVMYLTNGRDKLGAAAMRALVEKILNATAAVADDGKYWASYYGLGEPRELDMSRANFDAWNFIAQWSYKTGGKWVTATLGVVPAEEPEGQDNYSWEASLAFNY